MTADRAEEAAEAEARRRLAGLLREADEAQALLTGLQLDLAQAQVDWDASQAARLLLEANEQLVVSALLAQQNAETAAAALDEAVHSADLDALTQLPTRGVMQDRLQHAIVDARRRGMRLALLFVDLDHFKPINDLLGHAVGDAVLVQVARSLVSVVRESDTVSRHGGDEFLILLADLSQPSAAARIATKLTAALAELTFADGRVCGLTASVGISLYPDDGDRADSLIALADAAMYRAKREGDGKCAWHGERPAGEQGWPPPPAAAHSAVQRAPAKAEVAVAEHGHLHEHLHDRLQEANQQLVLSALSGQELLGAAQRKLQRQAESLALVAHELVNPLATIRNATAVAARLRATEKRLPEMHRLIERQVAQMSRLVGDLLDVSRAEIGKLRLEFKRVELDRLVDDAVDTGLPAIERRRQHFDVRVVQGLLPMRGDPVRLSQVLRNLLDNASKYTPEGGTIGLAVERRGDDAVVTVSDSGIGISAEALPHVFEPFVQDARATTFDGSGLGVGLTVVRELVQAHGGHVAAHSAGRGRGSRFVVTLPLDVPVTDEPLPH